jgi:hypothetical protein
VVFLFSLVAPGLFLMAPVAAASAGSPYAGGVWLTGDHHMHTTASDGIHEVVDDVVYAEQYGLDFIAITNHGGKANEPKIYAEYEEIVTQRVYNPNLLIFHGFEWNVPGGEHATFMVAPGPGEREQVRDFMTKFDASCNPQADAIAALRYAEKMNPKPLVILNHPSRKGKYSLEEIRAYDDAGSVAAGFEGAPGHQAGSDRGEYKGADPGSSRTFGGFDKMVAEVGGVWDTLLSEGRKWFITANSDFHKHVTEGGADFWPGEYSKTYLWAPEKSYSAVLDSLRNGRSFVVHGDLIDALEFSAETGGETAALGGTLSCPEGADVKVTIKVRDPQTTNNQGENPVLKQVQLISNVSGTPEITKVFKSGDWVEQDGYLVMEHTFKNVTRDFYVRVRGSNTDEINPAEDPQNEDPWQDLWFYSNPIFIKPVSFFIQITDLHLSDFADAQNVFQAKCAPLPYASQLVDEIKTLKPSFVVATGDLVAKAEAFPLEKGLAWFDLYLQNVVRPITDTGIPFYHVPGNHDVGGTKYYKKIEDVPVELREYYGDGLFTKKTGSPTFYSFNAGDYHYIVLDPAEVARTVRLPEDQLNWLKNDLEANKEKNIILFFHQPSSNWENWDEVRSLLEGYKVKMLFCGHWHTDTAVDNGFPEQATSAFCGCWWRETVGKDGFPLGYRLVYPLPNGVRDFYKELDTREQINILSPVDVALTGNTPLVVQAFDAAEPIQKISYRVDGGKEQPMLLEKVGLWYEGRANLEITPDNNYHKIEVVYQTSGGKTFTRVQWYKFSSEEAIDIGEIHRQFDRLRGRYATIKGTVTAAFADGQLPVIEDETGGITVWAGECAGRPEFYEGQGLVLRGKIATDGWGLQQLHLNYARDVQVTGAPRLQIPRILEIPEIQNHLYQLVKVKQVKVTEIKKNEFYVEDKQGRRLLIYTGDVRPKYKPQEQLKAGDLLTITGIAWSYFGEPEVCPRYPEDIVTASPPTGGGNDGGGSPSTSTPPGAATPVSDSVFESAIKQAAETGKVTLEAARDKGAVALKVEQVNRLVQEARPVEVKIGDVQLVVPADVIKAAASLAASVAQVEVQAKPVAKDTASSIVREAKNAGQFKLASDMVELELAAYTKDGKKETLTTFSTPVKIMLPVPADKRAQADSLVIGRYNEADKAWETLSTTYDEKSGTAVAETSHFSKYALLEKVAQAAVKTFADIQGHWAQKDIELMAEKGVVRGVAPGKFAPDAQVTRAEFAAMLVNALGVTESSAIPFTDVPDNAWYYQSVARAYAAGLVKGVSSTGFAPQAQITRQEMAAMLVRALAKLGRPVEVGADEGVQILGRFNDRQEIAPWAADALAAAVKAGVVVGRGNDLVAPKANATRAEAVVMIKRVLQTAGKL